VAESGAAKGRTPGDRWLAGWKVTASEVAIMYLRNPLDMNTVATRDRPESGARRYLARFFGFFFGAFPCGFGGVLSILRSTSSGLMGGLGFSVGMLEV
jgi:hypothetical protein